MSSELRILELRNLGKTYKSGKESLKVLHGIDLDLEAGNFVAFQGPSGCGKSTLLLTIGGLLEPETGEIKINGQDIYAMSGDERARFRAQTIGFVFQQFHLIPYLNILENVLTPSLAWGAEGARERAMDLIQHFRLESRIKHLPGELSTGEKQRVALARALLNGPKIILADEPTGNLDNENATTVFNHLAEFARKGGCVLMATHDDRSAGFADRVIRMRDGGIPSASDIRSSEIRSSK